MQFNMCSCRRRAAKYHLKRGWQCQGDRIVLPVLQPPAYAQVSSLADTSVQESCEEVSIERKLRFIKCGFRPGAEIKRCDPELVGKCCGKFQEILEEIRKSNLWAFWKDVATGFIIELASAGWSLFTLGANPGLDDLVAHVIQSQVTQPGTGTLFEFASAVGKEFLSSQANIEDLEKVVVLAIEKSLADVCVCKEGGCHDAQLSCTGEKPMERERTSFHFVDLFTPLKGGQCWKQPAFNNAHTSDFNAGNCIKQKLSAYWPSWIDCEIPVFDGPGDSCHCSPGHKQDWLSHVEGDWQVQGCEGCTFLESHPDIITESGNIDYERMHQIAMDKRKEQQDFDAPDSDETNGLPRRRRSWIR